MCIHTYMQTYLYRYKYTSMCTHTYICHIYVYMCIYIYTYVYINYSLKHSGAQRIFRPPLQLPEPRQIRLLTVDTKGPSPSRLSGRGYL